MFLREIKENYSRDILEIFFLFLNENICYDPLQGHGMEDSSNKGS